MFTGARVATGNGGAAARHRMSVQIRHLLPSDAAPEGSCR